MKELALQYWYMKIAELKKGKLIKRGYAKSTKIKRKKYGLQTKHVDLFGSTRYSKKQWRMLDQGKVRVLSKSKAHIQWKRQDAARLYSYHVKRYGVIF